MKIHLQAVKALCAAGVAFALLAAAWPAAAQAQPGPHGGRRFDRPGPPPQRPVQPQREWRQAGDGAPPQRGMSPEERRNLRRDIYEHGRQVYRNPDRRP
jgi:hypothetical protein